jgi:hypothetical protein
MGTVPLKHRVEALEAEVGRLKAKLENGPASTKPWWEQIWGSFAGDPSFQEAMRLGRRYREAQRPKSSSRRKD